MAADLPYVFLVWTRIAALLAFAPLLGSISPPGFFKPLFSLAISAAVVSSLSLNGSPSLYVPHSGDFVLELLNQVFIGAVLGFGIQAAFATFSMAGRLIDTQIGFGLAGIYDPVMKSQSPILGTALSLYASAVFFLTNAHCDLIRAIKSSFESLPIGGQLGPDLAEVISLQFAIQFSLAVTYVAPVILGLLLIEIGLSVLSRVMPQMNMIFLGVPVKIIAGLALLALTVPLLQSPTQQVFAHMFRFFEAMTP